MRALYLLFALLFLVFQDQARSADQDEPQESALLVETEGARGAPGIHRSCAAHGGQCRNGICPWKETKILSCGFARPCCKKML